MTDATPKRQQVHVCKGRHEWARYVMETFCDSEQEPYHLSRPLRANKCATSIGGFVATAKRGHHGVQKQKCDTEQVQKKPIRESVTNYGKQYGGW